MDFALLGDLNWLAVIVAGFIYFALGALWYAPPVFGKTWMASIGWDAAGDPPAMTPMGYIGPLVGYIVSAAAIGMLAMGTGTDTLGEGIVLGLTLGIGVGAVLAYVTGVFDPKSPKPMTWAAVTGGYHAVGLMAQSVLLAVWI